MNSDAENDNDQKNNNGDHFRSIFDPAEEAEKPPSELWIPIKKTNYKPNGKLIY